MLLATIDMLSVGKIGREKVAVAITDLSHIGNAVGAKLDGDLGYNFLQHFCVTINYRTLELKLEDPGSAEAVGAQAQAYADVPVRLAYPSKPLLVLDAQVNGRGPLHFAVDTGTSTTMIAPEIARDFALALKAINPTTTGGAPIETKAAQIQTLRVGSVERSGVDVIVGEFLAIFSNVIGNKLDGIIGYNFLRHYKLMIDYPNERFRLG